MTRDEHLAWCKKRALEYVVAGDMNQAFASLVSDLRKHQDTAKCHESTNQLGMQLLTGGHLKTATQMRSWIEGYN